MSQPKIIGIDWDFSSLMNEAIRAMPEKPMQKRSHIWASELGGSFVDRYLKMHAHPYSNPINDRSKRKFVSGHIFEWIVNIILTLTGVIKEKQLRGEVELKGCLRVSGKLDFIAGGIVDWEKAKEEVKHIRNLFAASIDDMPPIIFHSLERVLWRMEQMFSRIPLKEVILECKAVSGFVFDLIEKSQQPRNGHPLQILHYILANKNEYDGELLYINKDAFMCNQFSVTSTKDLLKKYRDDVKTMTELYNNSGKNYLKNIPQKESEVMFEDGGFRFMKNNHVEYSPYLTMLYGYKDIDEFKLAWQKRITGWNRVFKRIVKGENITPANKIIIDDMKTVFPLLDKYVVKAKAAGAFLRPDEEDEE